MPYRTRVFINSKYTVDKRRRRVCDDLPRPVGQGEDKRVYAIKNLSPATIYRTRVFVNSKYKRRVGDDFPRPDGQGEDRGVLVIKDLSPAAFYRTPPPTTTTIVTTTATTTVTSTAAGTAYVVSSDDDDAPTATNSSKPSPTTTTTTTTAATTATPTTSRRRVCAPTATTLSTPSPTTTTTTTTAATTVTPTTPLVPLIYTGPPASPPKVFRQVFSFDHFSSDDEDANVGRWLRARLTVQRLRTALQQLQLLHLKVTPQTWINPATMQPDADDDRPTVTPAVTSPTPSPTHSVHLLPMLNWSNTSMTATAPG